MDTLTLDDVRFFGRHGVTKAEESVGAWFSVDVALSVDLAPAAVSDDLGAAVDYGAVAKRVVEIGTGARVNLIERLAGLMAEALLREFPAREVRVRLRKMTAPLDGLVGTPGVEMTRRR
ncbi:MAG: dihydroneopterin aldolase [Candidatus Rokubacteria bacterium]|nr:dihydroneopterin aldolase [Candidatus Rokubacteria bacterium]